METSLTFPCPIPHCGEDALFVMTYWRGCAWKGSEKQVFVIPRSGVRTATRDRIGACNNGSKFGKLTDLPLFDPSLWRRRLIRDDILAGCAWKESGKQVFCHPSGGQPQRNRARPAKKRPTPKMISAAVSPIPPAMVGPSNEPTRMAAFSDTLYQARCPARSLDEGICSYK